MIQAAGSRGRLCACSCIEEEIDPTLSGLQRLASHRLVERMAQIFTSTVCVYWLSLRRREA
jgi:hypothetical protein